jgi:hypothetical protein
MRTRLLNLAHLSCGAARKRSKPAEAHCRLFAWKPLLRWVRSEPKHSEVLPSNWRVELPTIPAIVKLVQSSTTANAISPWSRSPRIVLCLGMYSSASTWIFNVIVNILRSYARGKNIIQFYADDPEVFPKDAANADYAVVKSHMPSAALLALAHFTNAPIVTSIREPRDAVASLMMRFSYSFADAAHVVAASAIILAKRDPSRGHLVLRYEDRFYDEAATVQRIASCLGSRISLAAATRIFAMLTRVEVRRKIAELADRGVFGADYTVIRSDLATRFDPETHWHPRHVGEAKVGQYQLALSKPQQVHVALATRSFCRAFGYSAAPTLAGCGTLDFTLGREDHAYLMSGFSDPERSGIWTDGSPALIRLPFAALPQTCIRLRLEFIPFVHTVPPKTLKCRVDVAGHRRPDIDCPAGPLAWRDYRLELLASELPVAAPLIIDIILMFAELMSPKDIGISNDGRQLGIMLSKLDYQTL